MSTLVLIGPHGAGKTTLGKRLAAVAGSTYHDVLGRRLMEANLAAGPDATARPEDFDARVFRAEVRRDIAWMRRPGLWHIRGTSESCHMRHRVVETWHLGNLAYALVRNPRWARPQVARVRTEVLSLADHEDLRVQPLTASPEVLRARLSEPGEASVVLPFFREVAELAEDLATRWGLCVLPALDTTPPHVVASLAA